MSVTDRVVTKTVLALALIMVLLIGCGGESGPISDSTIIRDLTSRLRQENGEHYAFGCVDFDGTVLSSSYSPDDIAAGADIERDHVAASWAADTGGVVLGGSRQPQYIVIHDPADRPSNAQEFERREAHVDGGALTCFVPK